MYALMQTSIVIGGVTNFSGISTTYKSFDIKFYVNLYTVRPLLYAVVGRTKFWPKNPRIIEVSAYNRGVLHFVRTGITSHSNQ